MTTIPSTLTAPWAICHRSCFGKEDRPLKTAGGTGIRGQDHPGKAGAQALNDLPNDDWQRFVCIEPVRVSRPCVLQPGEGVSVG